MVKKNGTRKPKSFKSRQRRVATYCGAPCDLDKGHLCDDCKEWRQMVRNRAGQCGGGSA